MKITGSCHCGAITFEAEIDPAKVGICHCTDCQSLSGAPFRAAVPASPENFRILSGKPAIYVKTADSGARRAQAFCGTCGSSIYSTAADNPAATFNIRLGVVRQRDELVPKRQIWARSRQPWVDDLSSIPSVAAEPAG